MSGLLYSLPRKGSRRPTLRFLDVTGGEKPYLLEEMDNNMGAVTRVEYEPSTRHYLRDRENGLAWNTTLPFPVQTVARVEALDEVSGSKMTTEYDYHHGYWDGHEREFRGFARVDQRDSESFEDYDEAGLFPDKSFESVPQEDFSPPTETRRWFVLGGVRDASGDWQVPDFSDEFWEYSDPSKHPNELLGDWVYAHDDTDPNHEGETLQQKLDALGADGRREALRALRGREIRRELFARDGSAREEDPYTVTERAVSFRHDASGTAGDRNLEVFFPYALASRTTEWERGDDAYAEQVARLKAMWQSRRDLAGMVDRCLRNDTVGFDVFYGVSANDRRWFDIEHARDVLGYDPEDNGDEWDAPPD